MSDAVERRIPEIPEAEEVVKLIRRVDAGKARDGDMEQLLKVLRETPLWRVAGDLAALNQARLIQKMTKEPVAKESFIVAVEEIKRGLDYDASPVVEQLMIEEIILCWLRLGYMHYCLTGSDGQSATLL
ncbi:MAG: hypothetical protein M3220_16430 [Chloroflexota bacterium]|nr:hypothetical protein [Chloroflexota bacterium]